MIKAAAVCIIRLVRSSAVDDDDVIMLPRNDGCDAAADLRA